MRTPYAWEKLNIAVVILAAGGSNLRERLKDALAYSLTRLHADDFSEVDTRNRFTILMDEIAPEGRFDIAPAAWSEEDLQRFVESIVGLFDAIARRMGAMGR